jgi:hypothetical protein
MTTTESRTLLQRSLAQLLELPADVSESDLFDRLAAEHRVYAQVRTLLSQQVTDEAAPVKIGELRGAMGIAVGEITPVTPTSSVPPKMTQAEALRSVGFDVSHYRAVGGGTY